MAAFNRRAESGGGGGEGGGARNGGGMDKQIGGGVGVGGQTIEIDRGRLTEVSEQVLEAALTKRTHLTTLVTH